MEKEPKTLIFILLATLFTFIFFTMIQAYIHELLNQKINTYYGIRSKIIFLPYGFKQMSDYYWNNTYGTVISETVTNTTDFNNLFNNNKTTFNQYINAIQANEDRVNNSNDIIYSSLLSLFVGMYIVFNLT